MNVYMERFPTADRYLVFFKNKLVAQGNDLPSITKYAQSNTGTELVDKVKGVKLMEWNGIMEHLQNDPEFNKDFPDEVPAKKDVAPTNEEVAAIMAVTKAYQPPVENDSDFHEEFPVDIEEDRQADQPIILADDGGTTFEPQKAPVSDKPKRGRPVLYDLNGLEINEKLLYKGNIQAARTMVSLNNKKLGKTFWAFAEGENVFIIRKA